MAKIFMVRVDEPDFDKIREEYGEESLQATDDEQAMRDFLLQNGLTKAEVWKMQ